MKTIILFFFSTIALGQEQFPIIIDSLAKPSEPIYSEDVKAWEKEVVYIGNWKDTIVQKYRRNRQTAIKNHLNYELEHSSNKNLLLFNANELKLVVDTTQLISFSKTVYKKDKEDNYISYDAYPVLIKNTNDKTVHVGYWYYIPIILQAKNKQNEWMDVERIYFPDCFHGMHYIDLKPDEILITTTPKYKGDYKTKLRVKYLENYSNEFYGEINYSQIE